MRDEEDIPSAKLRLACNSFNNFSGPTGFLCLRDLDLRQCPGIEDGLDSWMQPDFFPVLTDLWLSETGIVTIPESISRFTTLRNLYIRNCKKLREIPRLPQSIRLVSASNCDRLDTQSSSRLLNQFREILAILPNTVAEAATSFDSEWPRGDLILPVWPSAVLTLPVTEIPKWLKFNHHQSVGNSVSFLIGPKISNLVFSIAFPSKDLPNNLDYLRWRSWFVLFSINGITRGVCCSPGWEKSNYDHLWLMYWKVNISNPSEENRVEVENWENILKLSLLQDLTKVKPSDPDVFHLLGEVKYEFKGLSCFILVR
nr:hypothetical protein CFP56_29628 [Quercus suber]